MNRTAGILLFNQIKIQTMGKINKGILGGFSGTLGPAVGSSWKGIQVIRSRPPRKRGRSTDEQLKQMKRMELVSKFLAPLTDLLNKTYDSVTSRMSCFNKALSYNIRNAIDGEYPEFRISYPRVILGNGDLLNPELLSSHSAGKGQLNLIWKDNSNEGSARGTDQAFAAAYCPETGEWVTWYDGPLRNAGSSILDITECSGKAVHAYIGFLSAGGKFVSTSQYAGLVNIL
jgi:hypothetical protein